MQTDDTEGMATRMNVFAEYWYLWLLLVVLAVAAFFVWGKAAAAVRKHGEKRAEIEEKLRYEARLRKEYAVLTPQKIAEAPQDTLLDGVVCRLQQRLEKQPDMTKAFQACSMQEREMYALYYVCEDGAQKLSRFFRINGEPLLALAPQALLHVDAQEEARIAAEEYEMFDEGNEAVSLDRERLDQLDLAFKNVFCAARIKSLAADYIRADAQAFLQD